MKKKKPKNPAHMGLYRAIMSCRLGCDALDGKINTPANVGQTQWAVYNLLKAVEEIAKERLEGYEQTRKALTETTNRRE